jgi:pyocin large subunit-like protein
MHENWQPSDDFVMRARMWGHALPADGYKKSDLIEFITYWMAEGNVMQHVQWEQKFARLLMNRKKERQESAVTALKMTYHTGTALRAGRISYE